MCTDCLSDPIDYIGKCNFEARLWKSHCEGILDFIAEAGLLFLRTDVVKVLKANRQRGAARRGAVHLKPQLRVRVFPENAPSKRKEEKKTRE